jgi:hypothetical protein
MGVSPQATWVMKVMFVCFVQRDRSADEGCHNVDRCT